MQGWESAIYTFQFKDQAPLYQPMERKKRKGKE